MTISITPETQRLLEEQMRKGGYATPDDVVRLALQTLNEAEGESIEDLDEETQAAIERAEAQSERGEGQAWDQAREELRARYLKP